MSKLYEPNAEMCVIGAIIKNNDCMKYAAQLVPDDFADLQCRAAFETACALYDEKRPIDLVTMIDGVDAIYGSGRANDAFLIDAARYCPAASNIRAYIELVLEASQRRKLHAYAREIAAAAEDAMCDITAAVEDAKVRLNAIQAVKGETQTIASAILAAYEDIENRSKGEIKPVQTGVTALDNIIGGFFPGELTIIGARPAVGKSAFAMQIALHAAIKTGKKPMFVSAEMVDSQFGLRLLARASRINAHRLRTGKLDENDWSKLAEATSRYADLPITFSYELRTIEDICQTTRRKVELGNCDMLIVDYLQLLRTRKSFKEDRLRVDHISKSLKSLTTELKIPVIALAQVRRQNLNGRSRCPVLDDLRDSGAIEQDADNVIFLHRPDNADDPCVIEPDKGLVNNFCTGGEMQYIVFSVDKQRQGKCGICASIFHASNMYYTSIERKADEHAR